MSRIFVKLFFGIEMLVNLLKLVLYALVAIWIFFYMEVINVTEAGNKNPILLEIASALNNNILLITASIAILEVIAHALNIQSIMKSHKETSEMLDDIEEKQKKRKFELILKNPKDKVE